MVGGVKRHAVAGHLASVIILPDGGKDGSHVVVEDSTVTRQVVGAALDDSDGAVVEKLGFLAVLGPVSLVPLFLQVVNPVPEALHCNQTDTADNQEDLPLLGPVIILCPCLAPLAHKLKK